MTKIEREYMMSLEIDRKRLADDLAALRIEHAAWGTLLDVTRKDRDAARAEVAALTAGIDAVIDRNRLTNAAPEILLTLQRHYEMVCETAGKGNDTIEDIGKVLKFDALDSDDVVADVRARVAELERLQASIHKAADAARKAERADVMAWLHGPCGDPAHDPRWCETCEARKDYATSIEEGAHEGAAGA